MQYPLLYEIPSDREMVDVFKGYNHNLRIGDGEFYDMENLTSDYYPVLSPREPRGTVFDTSTTLYGEGAPTSQTGAVFVGQLYVDTTTGKAYECRGKEVTDGVVTYKWVYSTHGRSCIKELFSATMALSADEGQHQGYRRLEKKPAYLKNHTLYIGGDLATSEHINVYFEDPTLFSMGTYIVEFPHGYYVNTAKSGDEGQIYVLNNGEASVTMCGLDESTYEVATGNISATPPENPDNGTLWIDTSGETHALKKYASATDQWVSVITTYLKIAADGIGAGLSEGDGVTISGDGTLSGIYVLTKATEDYIIVTGFIDKAFTANISVTRELPKLDFVFECANRAWGCFFGISTAGEPINEIYASKLGDFKNWKCFAGISTDSYAVSIGSDGPFTGAINYLGQPLFFKEGCLHRVYGSYPANYQLQTITCPGVQIGSGRSLAIVDGVLYYKGKDAVYAYDGSMPISISQPLGDLSALVCTSACAYNHKLYMIMKEGGKAPVLFVYDTQKSLWHKEVFSSDVTDAHDLCEHSGQLYCVETTADGEAIRAVYGNDEGKVPWSAETGILGISSPDKKSISRLSVRMSLGVGSRVMFYLQYDSSGNWEHVATMNGTSLRTFTIPIRPKRCDHMRLRMVGEGDAKVFSITKTIEQGSDV